MHFTEEPRSVVACRNNLGESILWDELTGRLVWVDIHVGRIYSWEIATGGAPTVQDLGERVGAIGLRRSSGFVLGLERRFAFMGKSDGALEDGPYLKEMPTSVRLNDGRVDPAGRFLCGGMDEANPQQHIAALYSLDRSGAVAKVLGGIGCTNSLCWSPDGSVLYFSDMPSATIEAFDYDIVTGGLSNRRIFADLKDEPGLPDGSCVDAEGYLWNAQWGGGKLVRYSPDGKVDREVQLPVTNPTCPTFGGENLDVLFVATAQFGLSEEQLAKEELAGDLIAFRPGVHGRLEHRFAG